jgi:hypothetical protein
MDSADFACFWQFGKLWCPFDCDHNLLTGLAPVSRESRAALRGVGHRSPFYWATTFGEHEASTL